MAIRLNPYLNFNGNTKEAMEFYQSVFGGDLDMHTFGEYPDMPVAEGYKDKIMHAQLEAEDIILMASEGEPSRPTVFGDNVSLSLNAAQENKDKITGFFNALAEGGEITMPLADQVWGDTFGMLKDKYGLYWMVNITKD